ncbi:MAG: 4Fe-4S dicluster domain-containing protein [Anaerolineales bacterium]|nr:4Fe-4S dicluster domain-containing protein [Chloroflexota bacterium]MBL6980428.1 4Fe-4S dicluster domain-containing protein [Anaerolineales bacterium]
MTLTTIFLLLIGLIFFAFFGAFGFVSITEGERRAKNISFGIASLGAMIFFIAAGLAISVQFSVLSVVLVALVVGLALFLLPIGSVDVGNDIPVERFDEREIMFARARLEPGSPKFESYYAEHPEHRKSDDRTREMPGLLSLDAKFANRYHFASLDGSFFLTGALREAVDGVVTTDRTKKTPGEITKYLKGLAHFFGALDVGVTELKPYHFYSNIGRGTGEYGGLVPVEHRYAIAFTVEMDFDMVGTAPKSPISMETGKQYVESARVAVQLAETIRLLGYEARAHIDGNYRVIAPLVARDAGLGEIGRMTILMTPKQGPRVRLGVVTTTLELVPNEREPNTAMIDFCYICKKCAENCPSRSISFDDRQEYDGALRWKIDPDTCFRYWNTVGTDCGKCMAVCPYSHPDNWAHNVVRWGIQYSGAFRRAALWLDDLFYGKEPAEKPTPEWAEIE